MCIEFKDCQNNSYLNYTKSLTTHRIMDILCNPAVIVKRVIYDDYPNTLFIDITFKPEATLELFNQVREVLVDNMDESDSILTTRMTTQTTFDVKEEFVEENERRKTQIPILMDKLHQNLQDLRDLGVFIYTVGGDYNIPMEWRKNEQTIRDATTGKYEVESDLNGTFHKALIEYGIL